MNNYDKRKKLIIIDDDPKVCDKRFFETSTGDVFIGNYKVISVNYFESNKDKIDCERVVFDIRNRTEELLKEGKTKTCFSEKISMNEIFKKSLRKIENRQRKDEIGNKDGLKLAGGFFNVNGKRKKIKTTGIDIMFNPGLPGKNSKGLFF